MLSSLEKINTQIFQDFLPHIRLIRTIGQGAFAQVYLIYDQKLQIYLAVKKIPLFGLCQYERKLVLNQAKILSSIHHPNIIQFHSCLYDNNQENVYIFMEYAKQGDLLNLIFRTRLQRQQIKQKIIWKIISDITQALNYLHSNNIIHRDVKPANILQQGDTFKLADMNVSKIKQDGRMTCTNVGTPLYTSPQVAKNQFYNQKCDIWSLGVVIYELCCFKNPFTRASLTNLIFDKDKQTKSAIQKIPLRYSRSLSDIIKRMLIKNPQQRISIKQILEICKNEGMSTKYIPSNQKLGQFKTIVFPTTSQRWVNLVQDKGKKKQDLDLTIDEILKESQIKQDDLDLKDSIIKNQFSRIYSTQNKDEKQDKYKNVKHQNPKMFKQTQSIILSQDEYELSNISIKKNILKTNDKNIIKVNNFLKKQIQNLNKPTHHRIINQKRFLQGQYLNKENSTQYSNNKTKSISTDKHRKFHRQHTKAKAQLSHSKQKQHNQYGFKFIKLSKNLQHLHS